MYNIWKKFREWSFKFWSYWDSNMGDRTFAQRNSEHFKVINSSGDEIANVNFLYDDIVHILQIQSTRA